MDLIAYSILEMLKSERPDLNVNLMIGDRIPAITISRTSQSTVDRVVFLKDKCHYYRGLVLISQHEYCDDTSMEKLIDRVNGK